MKYIVKNCGCNPSCDECYNRCADISDCIIKQVIEKCKEETKLIRIYEGKDKGTAIAEYSLSKDFAQEILDMFDIEEINK